jgi:magnesium chelatase family protein
MLTKTHSYGIIGLDAYPICIEVDVSKGLPATKIVGLPDNAIKESKERIRSAIRNSGYDLYPRRITVNLSPADTKKEGPAFDLPIALGILAATEQIPEHALHDFAIIGELSLDGRIQPVKGSLAITHALGKRFKGIIVPQANAAEAALVQHARVYPVNSLNEVVHLLHNINTLEPYQTTLPVWETSDEHHLMDFADVKGQNHVKRGLEIAAAGQHNCLLVGPPGTGKSLLSKCLPGILPNMTQEESLETTKIHSVMGLLKNNSTLVTQRPFRAPHHTTSDIAIVGGGSTPKPGEITLAHNGVLFMDELPEFNRNVLESLRQPLEDQSVTIARTQKTSHFPAKFMFVAAMNPCPCGHLTNPRKTCHCTPTQIQRYLSRISGPLLDRIDLHLEVPSLSSQEIIELPQAEQSAMIKERTVNAHNIQQQRFQNSNTASNAQMTLDQIRTFCPLTSDGTELLKAAITQLNLSARAHDKIIKIARTIADLADEEYIQPEHIAEAIQYRNLDRDWWG